MIRRTPIKRGPKKVRSFSAVHAFDLGSLQKKEPKCVTAAAAKRKHRRETGVSLVAFVGPGGYKEFKVRMKSPFLSVGFSSKPRKKIRQCSPKKAAGLRKYTCAKAEHFKEHPECQYPGGCTCSWLNGDKMDLHHKAGRNGPLLYTKKYFATACRRHHDLAKSDIKRSREIGWIVDISSEEVRALRTEEILSTRSKT